MRANELRCVCEHRHTCEHRCVYGHTENVLERGTWQCAEDEPEREYVPQIFSRYRGQRSCPDAPVEALGLGKGRGERFPVFSSKFLFLH